MSCLNMLTCVFRWDAPPHGYMSITDQQEVEDKQSRKEELRQRVVAEQQEVHGPSEAREERIHRALPDMSVKVSSDRSAPRTRLEPSKGDTASTIVKASSTEPMGLITSLDTP